MTDKPKEKAPFCWNSRRWLDFSWRNCTCVKGGWCNSEDRCDYYEDREITPYYKKKLAILKKHVQ